jgi:tetratricopeptide (TPR) repeat protein
MKNLPNRINSILIKGLNFEKFGELEAAKKCFLEVYSKYPDYPDLINNIAKLCMQLNQNEEAHIMLLRSLNKNPLDYKILITCAYVQLKLGIISEAEKNIRTAIDINENQIDGYLSLSAILVAKEDFDSALKAATAALNIDPFSTKALNNLGAIFNKMGDSKSSRSCFETSLVIDHENNYLAIFNLASILYSDGEIDESINLFESIINNPTLIGSDFEIQAKFSLSYAYLSKGDLIKGWDYYQYGFNYANPVQNRRAPNRSFNKSKWNFDNLNGKTLLVWGEQGIGDEIFFFSVLHELLNINGKIIVECEPRLVQALSRSYPNFKFKNTEYKNDFSLSSIYMDYDFHISAGDLMGHFRTSIENFKKGGPYMKADKEKSMIFQNKLNAISSKPKIGISWRSGKLSSLRNIHYTNLKDWGPIFELSDNHDFINLQYGECEEELLEAEKKYNLKIHRWNDLDLKNDIDSVYSLISSLDYVISIGNAVAVFAGSVGTEVLLMSKKSWTNFGTDGYPAFANIEFLCPEKDSPVETVIPVAAQILNLKFKILPKIN